MALLDKGTFPSERISTAILDAFRLRAEDRIGNILKKYAN